MITASSKPVTRKKFPLYGYLGFLIMITAEAFLFAGNQVIGRWFTPVVWTGYILFVDALVYAFKSRSLLMTDRLEFLVIAIVSIGFWWLCEFYNAPRFWKSNLELWWHYQNLEPNLMLRRAGYDWAFATILPLLFITAELFTVTICSGLNERAKVKISKPLLVASIIVGAAGVTWPLLFPSEWLAPVVWLGFIFLIDPVNALRGWPSIAGDLARGDWRRLGSLLAAGLVCGVLWEFFNYWAIAKWTYTVPYFGNVKIFEMPVLGYLGFPPFAVECWVFYIFVRSFLPPAVRETNSAEVILRAA
jgi:hypothetical protein